MIEQLISRLQAASTDFQTIDHAWTLDEPLNDLRSPVPMALFFPGKIDAELSESLPVRQRATESVVVRIICKWQDLAGLRKQLREALIGYQHAPEYTELQYSKGDIHEIRSQYVSWMDMFVANFWTQGS